MEDHADVADHADAEDHVDTEDHADAEDHGDVADNADAEDHGDVADNADAEDHGDVADHADAEAQKVVDALEQTLSPKNESPKIVSNQPRRCPSGKKSQSKKKQGTTYKKRRVLAEKRRGQKHKKRGQEETTEGVTVKRTSGGGKRRWAKKHYCVFCRRPQVKIARHLLRKHIDEQEVLAASALPVGSKQRHLLLEHLRCRGNYLHNIEVIRQGNGEIIPWRTPTEEVNARNYLPCPLCLGFFLRSDLWKHQVSCRKKLAIDLPQDPASEAEIPFTGLTFLAEITSKEHVSTAEVSSNLETSDSADKSSCSPAEDTPTDPFKQTSNQSSEPGTKRTLTSGPGVDQNENYDSVLKLPRKRARVQAAASRLLPISGGASESCSEILHRMNQDNVSYEVKSDWLICKYGNKLMGNEEGGKRKYDYLSQKLRELGRLLLAAKSLDPRIQSLQDLLAPGHLNLVLSAAKKATGYRWSRPPLSLKTTLKTICEIAVGESLQDGDWEAAARTTEFYHILGKDWDNLGLQNTDTDLAAPNEGSKPKKQVAQSRRGKELKFDVLSQSSNAPMFSLTTPESRLKTPVPVPVPPGKVRRRPWSSAEKEAIWRQLGDHVLIQSVPGKEVCQRCLDLEPALRGRHWKDVKNQVYNQIQSQKKQQFHAQVELEENPQQQTPNQNQEREQQTPNQNQERQQQQLLPHEPQMNQQSKEPSENQKKQVYQTQMDLHNQDNPQNQKRPQYQVQVNHQTQDSIQNQKKRHEQIPLDHHTKQLCHPRLDQQDHSQVHKKQLYHMDQQNHSLHLLDRDTSALSVLAYRPDGPLRPPDHSILDREPTIVPYSVLDRPPGPHMDPLLTRTDWTTETLPQSYAISRVLVQNHLQEVAQGGPPPNPHSGHIHF